MLVLPVRDGMLVVPAVLPIHVSDDELKMTVADWLALKEIPMPQPEPIEVLDGQDPLPLPPFADASTTVLDPGQDVLPQDPGSAIDDEEVTAHGG
ncbi:hypothetical protein FAF44_03150 [Nonomuraea sp. MG754425]|uniref:hypothetical protein n=1 Tax=Nonomuraea sp. MG754425 TaxID=2570319 RepID=UPI001F390652|nr:hypothetical protein [Nonomuraea sp. MG754425]MCF6467413.1 hypothetical protein [Nonomuraea sp. MG754425]